MGIAWVAVGGAAIVALTQMIGERVGFIRCSMTRSTARAEMLAEQ